MLETPRLSLIACDETLFEAIKMGNVVLANVLGVSVAKGWTSSRDALAFAYQRWKADQKLREWWVYLIVLKEHNMLIGTCGYKGPPDEEGIVEIGYEIAPKYREVGLATEAASELVKNAFSDTDVKRIVAHTTQRENPSARLLIRLGFQTLESESTPNEMWWKWELGVRKRKG